MSEITQDRGKIDIGRVIRQLFAVLGRNLVTFSALALLLVGLPRLIVGLSRPDVVAGETADLSVLAPGLFYLSLLGLITGAILQGALIYGTVQDLNGRRPSVAESLATGLRAFLPLIGASILLGLGVAVGLILLIAPGVFLLCLWAVTIPALVAERTGVLAAFSRSAELTRGNRWRIFLLLVIWACVFLVLSMVLSTVAGVGVAITGDVIEYALSPWAAVVDALVSAASALVGATGAAVLYVELRQAREEAGEGWLADIFR